MKSGRPPRPTASLFVQLITLTGLTLVASQVISLLLIFNLPPPTPDFYRLSEIEQTFRGTAQTFTERRPLQLRRLDKPPGPAMEGRRAPRIRATLAKDLGVPVERIVIATDPGPFADRRVFRIIRDRIARQGIREEHFLVAPFEVAVQQDGGRWAVVRPEPAFGLTLWQQRIALWFVLSALAMAPAAYIFARRLAAPIRLFADAAERLGRDPRAEPLVLKGPAEFRAAVGAFNDMQQRLRRYVEDRTAMVAAIAHDLRTPLTRLRFRIEGLPEEQRAKIGADIDQMEEMISAAL
ncbi:MAG: sensor histidine kinase, partial [Phenylobacterium sp.]|nr:sensor histidine kinase [Phenylobacterium sp.]